MLTGYHNRYQSSTMQASHPRAEPQRIKERKKGKRMSNLPLSPSLLPTPRGGNPILPPPPPPVKGFPSFLLRFIRSAIPFIHSPTRCLSACLKKEEIGERARSNQRTSIYVQRKSSPRLLIYFFISCVCSPVHPPVYSLIQVLAYSLTAIPPSYVCPLAFVHSWKVRYQYNTARAEITSRRTSIESR